MQNFLIFLENPLCESFPFYFRRLPVNCLENYADNYILQKQSENMAPLSSFYSTFSTFSPSLLTTKYPCFMIISSNSIILKQKKNYQKPQKRSMKLASLGSVRVCILFIFFIFHKFLLVKLASKRAVNF